MKQHWNIKKMTRITLYKLEISTKFKMKNILFVTLFMNVMSVCCAQNIDYVYSQQDSIAGQIHTVDRMKSYMEKKQYEEAINLFSKVHQAEIKELQKNTQAYTEWCNVWTMNSKSYVMYVDLIKKHKAHFVFENGEWKIDEK